ncbi:hypothetical protein QTO34_016763 [Cnephaeus nilssonii]|uniref:Uncharacterized protein n=1 Tax=Cnephaeus nilssonii TaxID=3371016 RepID=A0AA40I2X8_CNENI|nr:hypothetical protein QTO34_016763 [Eptesicus nilssonii]
MLRSWRLQSSCPLQQPLQLQLWSQGRPQTQLRPHQHWKKNPPRDPLLVPASEEELPVEASNSRAAC